MIKSKKDTSIIEPLSESEEPEILNNSLSDQLRSSIQTRTLKLELENCRLLSEIESINENSFQKDSFRILELEKEKKELQLKLDSLIKDNDQLSQESSNLGFTSRIVELEKEKKELKFSFDSLIKNNERLILRNSYLDYTCKLMKQENQNLQPVVKNQQEEIEDQVTLESDHDQLSNDYLKLLQEQDTLRDNLAECQNELRSLNDSYKTLNMVNESLLIERENREDDLTLKMLKKEHTKLQVIIDSQYNSPLNIVLFNFTPSNIIF